MTASLYHNIINNTTDAIIVTETPSADGSHGPRIVFVNDAYVEMTGYSREEALGETPKILHGPETDLDELEKLRYAIDNEQPGRAEVINYKKNGEKFWTSIAIFPIFNEGGTCTHWVGIKRDITESKENELTIQKILQQKEAYLQEVQHRVRNNLAVILGIIQLKSMEIDEQSCQWVLNELTYRINSLAICQKLLYQYEDPNAIPIHECMLVQLSSMTNTYDCEIIPRLDDIFLNINQAIPMGFIFSEILLVCKPEKGSRYEIILTGSDEENPGILLQLNVSGIASINSLKARIENKILNDPISNAYVKQLRGTWKLGKKEDLFFLKFKFQKSSKPGSSANKFI